MRKTSPRKGRTRRRALRAVLLALSASLFAIAILLAIRDRAGTEDYARLAREAGPGSAPAAAPGGIDWDSLLAQNPEVVAWLSVGGTPIDLPVVQPTGETPEGFYLTHDLWRRWSWKGTPYLDKRADASGRNLLVFGHHLTYRPAEMFSPLHRAWRQDVFDGLGEAAWTPARGGAVRFRPLMAMSVDMDFAPVQTFDFDGDDSLREWLRLLAGSATARASGFDSLASSATRAMVLVTCSSDWVGRRERTIVVFVAG